MTVSPESSAPKTQKARAPRRVARQLALQMLFQHEFQDKNPSWQEKFWANQSVSPAIQAFTTHLVQGVLDHQPEIDQLIRRYAVDWSLERMPVVDRNILRVALLELLWVPDIPAMVTINEAIELAKCFADDEARKFVNGLLDRILREDPRLDDKRRQIRPRTASTS